MVHIQLGQPLGHGTGDITATEVDARDIDALVGHLPDFVVAVSADAPGCCIDGRPCVHTLGDTLPQPGPSVAGGPSLTAYAAAELVGDYFGEHSAQTSLGRIEEVNAVLVSGGIKLGAHVSRSALESTGKTFVNPATQRAETGCGANDKFVAIIHTPSREKVFTQAATALLLGPSFRAEYLAFVAPKVLDHHMKEYDARDALDAVAAYDEGRTIEILEGGHKEVLVVCNCADNTTIDRDRLVKETGRQVFVVDMWYIDRLARIMALGRPDAVNMEQRLRHAMTAFQVATYSVLCDGSHRPAIIKPQKQPALVSATAH